MRFRPWLFLTSLLLLGAALLSAACGGSGDDRGPPDLSTIVTATPPDSLPEPLIVGESTAVAPGITYIVQAGDTLSAIAEQFGTTVAAIAEENGIEDPRRLLVGQELIIPGSRPAGTPLPEATAGTPSASGGDCTYTVRSGDTASLLAQHFGITLEELAAANNTTIDELGDLSIGEELIVPCSVPTPTAAATPESPTAAATPESPTATATPEPSEP